MKLFRIQFVEMGMSVILLRTIHIMDDEPHIPECKVNELPFQ